MSARRALWAFVAAGGSVIAACGGTTDTAFKSSDGGGGKGTGGAVGSGGTAAGGKGGGQSGAGGAAGASGTGGAVTVPGDSGPCPPPPIAGDTRICLTLSPEKITARAEPELDERGILVVQIFDTPNPPDMNAGQVALVEHILPKDAVLGADAGPGAEIGLNELKEVRFDKAFPATVYIRAIFIDNRALLRGKNGPLGFGAWLGGLNLADGFQDKEPLLPVSLTVGQGNAVNLPLTALRRLRATVHLTATPIGDGQGPLTVLAVNNSDPAKKPPAFGLASRPCVDVVAGDVTLTGFVAGPGPYYVTGILNDLGSPKQFPPGALASLTQAGGVFTIPNKLTYPATAYAVDTTFDLSYAVPLDADAGPIAPNSCADLAARGDAGP